MPRFLNSEQNYEKRYKSLPGSFNVEFYLACASAAFEFDGNFTPVSKLFEKARGLIRTGDGFVIYAHNHISAAQSHFSQNTVTRYTTKPEPGRLISAFIRRNLHLL